MNIEYIVEEEFEKDVKIPVRAYNNTSACFDLFSVEDVEIEAGTSVIVKTGVRFFIPKGWYARVNSRSGNGLKKDLNVFPGIFDAGYLGDWSVKIYNLGKKKQKIFKGQGVAQVEFLKMPKIKLQRVSKKTWSKKVSIRGSRGHGSSDAV